MKIESVCIVGGGTSGWSTASALLTLCPKIKVTLVETDDYPIIGVGESTLIAFNEFLRIIDIPKSKDVEWMPECNATYKNGIRFTNFCKLDNNFFDYPFGNAIWSGEDLSFDMNTFFILNKKFPEIFNQYNFSEFFNDNAILMCHNKQTYENKINFNFYTDTAYHVDSEAFGQYLKHKKCLDNSNFNYINTKVLGPTFNTRGDLESLSCNDCVIEADLFVDCSGFRSMLLEQGMKQKFISFKPHLLNDKAWAVRVPYDNPEEELLNVTDCRAYNNGWIWNIPLWNRLGMGYVFSSDFITPDNAQKEFIEYLKIHRPNRDVENLDFNLVNIRHGYREKAWVKNVIGIGLSYGFIEPLESTGLATTHDNILRMCHVLNMRDGFVSNYEIQLYNSIVQSSLLSFRDFVAEHYAMSTREDTEYWKYCTNNVNYNENIEVAIYDAYSFHDYQLDRVCGGDKYITSGMGINPIIHYRTFENNYIKKIQMFNPDLSVNDMKEGLSKHLKDLKEKHVDRLTSRKNYVMKLDSSYEFLRKNIYG